MNYDKKYFSKVKESEVYKDKMHGNIIDDNFSDKMLSGEVNREDCDEENLCKFLYLLKSSTLTQVDNTKKLTEKSL